MNKEYIVVYGVQHCLAEDVITPLSFQQFLLAKDEVKTALPIEELQQTLDLLVFSGLIEVIHTVDKMPWYSKVDRNPVKKHERKVYSDNLRYLGAAQ